MSTTDAGTRHAVPSPTTPRLRHPITVWLAVVMTVVYAGLGLPRLFGYSVPDPALETVLSILAFVLLFGGAVGATALSEGRPGVLRLLSGLVRWRFGVVRWLVVLTALPVLTLGTAAVTQTLVRPPGGWSGLAWGYLLDVLAGLLLTSLWEEGAWAGFVQTRLMRRHGLVAAACLTAIPFTLVHIPGAFQNTTGADALVNIVAIALLAPVLRYLAGVLLLDTGGSILAVALLHASFNATGHLPAAVGGWQLLVALVVLACLVALHRFVRRLSRTRSSSSGRDGTAAQ